MMAVNAYLDIVNHNIKEHSYEKTEDNISKEERLALKQLMNRRDTIIKPADKGGATVVLDAEKYHDEAMRQLNDPNYCQKLNEIRQKDIKKLSLKLYWI